MSYKNFIAIIAIVALLAACKQNVNSPVDDPNADGGTRQLVPNQMEIFLPGQQPVLTMKVDSISANSSRVYTQLGSGAPSETWVEIRLADVVFTATNLDTVIKITAEVEGIDFIPYIEGEPYKYHFWLSLNGYFFSTMY